MSWAAPLTERGKGRAKVLPSLLSQTLALVGVGAGRVLPCPSCRCLAGCLVGWLVVLPWLSSAGSPLGSRLFPGWLPRHSLSDWIKDLPHSCASAKSLPCASVLMFVSRPTGPWQQGCLLAIMTSSIHVTAYLFNHFID